jgi:type I restriction enzyme S subunit
MKAEICALAPPIWEIRSVEDVCKRVTSGGTPSRTRPEFYVDGSWPWVKTQELQDTWIDHTEEKITNEAVTNSSAKVLPANTILLAMYGATVGQLGILRTPMTCNQACCAMIVDSDKADFRFLYHHLRYSRTQLKSLATGAAQQNLSGALIKSLLYPFPPIDEQKAITAVLGALDDKIELNRRMNATLEAMARALFQSWFVDFDPVRAKLDGRPPAALDPAPAALFPDSFQDSEAGHIPKGWTIQPVGEAVDCVGGGTPSTAEPKYWEGGTHHWTTPKDFSSLQAPVLLDTDRKLTDTGIAKISSGLLPAGTLLLSSRAPVGYLAIAAMPVAINQGFIAMKCNERASNFFMLNWCQANMAEIESRATGTTFAEISKQNFRPIRVVLPPKEIMAAFTAKVAPLYAQITANLHQSRTLATLRDTLLPKLLSGELSFARTAA